MVDPMTTRRTLYRCLFVGLAALLLFLRILPMPAPPENLPGPDLLLCITFVWLLRRPDYLPALTIVLVFLLEDMLLMRPPGLWPLIILFATEFLRDRTALTRDVPFLIEWAMVVAIIAAMLLANRLVLGLFMVPQAGLMLSLLQFIATAVAYPFVVWLSENVLNLYRATPGDMDALGARL